MTTDAERVNGWHSIAMPKPGGGWTELPAEFIEALKGTK